MSTKMSRSTWNSDRVVQVAKGVTIVYISCFRTSWSSQSSQQLIPEHSGWPLQHIQQYQSYDCEFCVRFDPLFILHFTNSVITRMDYEGKALFTL